MTLTKWSITTMENDNNDNDDGNNDYNDNDDNNDNDFDVRTMVMRTAMVGWL